MNLAQHALKSLSAGDINLDWAMTKTKSRFGPAKQKIIDNLENIKADINSGITYSEIARKYHVGRSTVRINLPPLLSSSMLEKLAYNGAYNSSLAVSESNVRRKKTKISKVQ